MQGQQGFTIVELLVGMAISGMIMSAIVSGIFQMIHGTARVNNGLIVQQDIDRASSWFNRDLSQAQTTDIVDLAAPVNNIRVDWTDLTGWATEGAEDHYVEYDIVPGTTNLKREQDGESRIIARYVANIEFSRSGNLITVSITSSFSGGVEKLNYFVTPRTDGALP